MKAIAKKKIYIAKNLTFLYKKNNKISKLISIHIFK